MGVIVLDTCHGQQNGREALEAAAIASLQLDVQVVVVGDEDVIEPVLREIAYDAERLRVLHAENSSLPIPTSIARGLQLSAQELDSVFISAGPSSSIVSEAHLRLQRLPFVKRAALAAVYPTLHSRSPTQDPFALLLDVGANHTCDAEDLLTFALMGAAYAGKIADLDQPRVALLSNGQDSSNAPPAIQQADLRLGSLNDDSFLYTGCIRGDQVILGDADVIVMDGFTGDILVRTLEGVALSGEALLKRAEQRFTGRIGVSMLEQGITQLREFTKWENYGGAPLLGLDRLVIVAPGDAGRRAFLNAIRLAVKINRLNVLQALSTAVADVHHSDHDK